MLTLYAIFRWIYINTNVANHMIYGIRAILDMSEPTLRIRYPRGFFDADWRRLNCYTTCNIAQDTKVRCAH